MNERQSTRRNFLKISAAAVGVIPVVIFSAPAHSATNAAMRASLKYQAKPEGDKTCAKCLQFVPGKSPTALGGCKILPGDTEVSPQGYCIGWAKKA